jgi:hypothetical protein
VEQLQENLSALDFALPEDLTAKLTEASAPEVVHPYNFFGSPFTEMINGDHLLRAWGSGQAANSPAKQTEAAKA